MDGRKTNDNGDGEIMYLDEIHDELSRPLRSDDLEAVHSSIGLRAGFPSDGDANNSLTGTEIGDLRGKDADGRPAIGFDARNGPELQPTNWTGGPIFPSSPPTVITTPDVNVYQHKKTLAQGMMDLALLSANANQMRYVLQTDGRHPYFYPSLTMIGMSLFLQIAVGIGLIWNSVYNIKEHDEMCKANKANNWTVIGIFLVTILNVFISSFGVVDQTTTVAA